MTDVITKVSIGGQVYPFAGGGSEVSAEDVSYDNSSSGAVADNMQDAMDEVFQSVSNGKTLIAAAITDKGVSTAASDSFATMAGNISTLPSTAQYEQNQLFIPQSITSGTSYSYLEVNNFGDVFSPDNSAYYKFAHISVSSSSPSYYYHRFLCWKKNALLDPIIEVSSGSIRTNKDEFRIKIDGNNIVASYLAGEYITGGSYTYRCINYNSSTGFSEVQTVGTYGSSSQDYKEAWTTICGISEEESLPAVNVTTLSVSYGAAATYNIVATLNQNHSGGNP